MNHLEVALVSVLALAAVAVWCLTFYGSASQTEDSTDQFPIAEGQDIDASELGRVESQIKGLIKVIVAANRVEEPQDILRQAVKHNFARNVEYHFLVSRSRSNAERDGWVNMFVAIARVVLSEQGSELRPRDLVHISHLSHEWRDTPYVFYQAEARNGQMSVVAFRGNQVDEGIADRYTRLPGHLAYTIANALLSDAPRPMTIVEDPFLVEPDIDGRGAAPREPRNSGGAR